jgi:hypothetical protein
MKILILSASIVGASLLATGELRTKYDTERALRITHETELTLETTDFSMERDGEPVDTSRFGGGDASATTTRVVHIDRVTALGDGVPSALQRAFETAERAGADDSTDSPLAGETLVLAMDEDGEVTAELESGASPDQDSVLAGHRLTLALDAFLPADGAEPGDSWTLDAEDVLEGLGITQSTALFPRPEWGGGGGGERGEGRRGPPGGRGAGTVNRILAAAEWDASASLEEDTTDVDGIECLVIALTLEGDGELEDEGFGGGRRGGRAFGATSPTAAVLATEFEIDLKGRLLYSTDLGRPVRLEIEGDYSLEMEMTREREDSSMTIYRAQEGSFTQTVDVTEEESAQ